MTGNYHKKRDIVEYLDSMIGDLEQKAAQYGREGETWTFIMWPETFVSLVNMWPVRYYYASFGKHVDPNYRGDLRGQMRRGKFLPMRGKLFPVILDDRGVPGSITICTEEDLQRSHDDTVAFNQ